MKIILKNFGPIEFLEFDLNNDLHLIYGKNSIGKSYATYTIYCLLKNLKNKSISLRQIFYRGELEKSPFHILATEAIKTIKKEKKNKEVNITDGFISGVNKYLEDIFLDGMQNSLFNTFTSLSNLQNRYSNNPFTITIEINDFQKIIISQDNSADKITLKYFHKNFELKVLEKKTISTKFSLKTIDKKVFGEPNETEFSASFAQYSINYVNQSLSELDSDIRDIYYLPASRSGLYQALNAFTPIIAELTQNRFFIQNKTIELPSLTEPLADYFIDLSTLDKTFINEEFNPIIDYLQNDILKGKVNYNEKTKKITYAPNNLKLELNLSESSSMVAELSPLVLYFKHILNHKFESTQSKDPFFYDEFYSTTGGLIRRSNRHKRGYDVIFIEEPEAHLHPEVQVKLMDLFSRLIGHKLKIFITSHSNYMFNKLNNIILKKEINVEKICTYHLVQGINGTYQNKEMTVTDEGIQDDNFQDISVELYKERMTILQNQDNAE
ncbi:MAG: AAA family ATPase [Bacteroidetes bacterium]|nr:MAG: AAA family ATPase [Bacteroidota bacterium]